MKRSGVTAGLWTALVAAAVLWPSHVLSAFDGVPLNGRPEALVVGVVLPMLWIVDRSFLRRPIVRAGIVALLALKIGSFAFLTQQGMCARFSTGAPLQGVISTIEINEPEGMLRSWDVRANWRARSPRCTAIIDRAYASRDEFPAAFVNLLNVLRPLSSGPVALDVSGFVTTTVPGELTFDAGADGTLRGGSFDAGVHPFGVHATFGDGPWRFAPRWNGIDAFQAVQFTASSPTVLSRISRVVGWTIDGLVFALALTWSISAVVGLGVSSPVLVWTATMSAVMFLAGASGRYERFAPLALLGATLLPIPPGRRHVRTALFVIAVPWIALFVGHGWTSIGRFTTYTLGDDWQVFQSAAYSIFLNGDWIRGGSPAFYYQVLYRWIAGVLHVLFGDSSVGETFWDAACLLAGALVSFRTVKRLNGFSWALATSALILATYTMGPIWYLIGRGLAEIAAVGWLSFAAFSMMRARRERSTFAAVAGVCAVLMFLTRTNHMLVTAFLLVFLLPLRTATRLSELLHAVRRVSPRTAAIYACVVASGIALFSMHKWWYTGHFSLTYGTSYYLQRTGLAPQTMFSPAVWSRIGLDRDSRRL